MGLSVLDTTVNYLHRNLASPGSSKMGHSVLDTTVNYLHRKLVSPGSSKLGHYVLDMTVNYPTYAARSCHSPKNCYPRPHHTTEHRQSPTLGFSSKTLALDHHATLSLPQSSVMVAQSTNALDHNDASTDSDTDLDEAFSSTTEFIKPNTAELQRWRATSGLSAQQCKKHWYLLHILRRSSDRLMARKNLVQHITTKWNAKRPLRAVQWNAKRLASICRWLSRSIRVIQRFTRTYLPRLRQIKASVLRLWHDALSKTTTTLQRQIIEHVRRYRMTLQHGCFRDEAFGLMLDCHIPVDEVQAAIECLCRFRRDEYRFAFRRQRESRINTIASVSSIQNMPDVGGGGPAPTLGGRRLSVTVTKTLTFRTLRLKRIDFDVPNLSFCASNVSLAEICVEAVKQWPKIPAEQHGAHGRYQSLRIQALQNREVVLSENRLVNGILHRAMTTPSLANPRKMT
jgi:hypothetical protein